MPDDELLPYRPVSYFIVDDEPEERPTRAVINDQLPFVTPETGFDRLDRLKKYPVSEDGATWGDDDEDNRRHQHLPLPLLQRDGNLTRDP